MKKKFDEKEFNKHGAWMLVNNFSKNNWREFVRIYKSNKVEIYNFNELGKVEKYFLNKGKGNFNLEEFSKELSIMNLNEYIKYAFKEGCVDDCFFHRRMEPSPFFRWNITSNEDEGNDDIFSEFEAYYDVRIDNLPYGYDDAYPDRIRAMEISINCSLIKCAMVIKAGNDKERKDKFIKAFPELFKNKYFSMDLVEARLRGFGINLRQDYGFEFEF